jgi:hypothetical protein
MGIFDDMYDEMSEDVEPGLIDEEYPQEHSSKSNPRDQLTPYNLSPGYEILLNIDEISDFQNMQFSMNDDKPKCSEDSISYDSGKLPSDLDTNSEMDYLPCSDNTSSKFTPGI